MKTKFKRFGKRTLSVLLSMLILVSSMMIGSIATIDASAAIISTDGSNTSVSLAGSMNNWSSTAWPLTYQGSDTHYSGTFYMPYSSTNYEAKVVVGSNWYTKVSSGGSAYWVTTSSGNSFDNRWGGLKKDSTNFQIQCISAASGYIKAEVHFYGKDPEWGNNNSFYLTQTEVSALSTTINNVSNNAEYDIGDTITLQSSATGGSGSYSHTYTVTRNGTDVTDSVITNNNVFTAPTVGTSTTYRITDTVSDANSQLSGLASATSYVDVVVKPAAVNCTGLSVKAQKSDNNSDWSDNPDGITTTMTSGGVATTEGTPTVAYSGSLDGYEFSGWYSANGGFADANSASTTFYPTADNSVAIARFLKTYSISSSQSGATGTVSVASNAKVGDSVTATITPPENYSVSSVTVRDASGGTVLTTNDGNDYTFTMPASNVNILVTYEETARYYLVGEIFTSIDGTKTGNWNGVNDFGMKYDSKSGDYYVDVIFTQAGGEFKIFDNNTTGEKYYGGASGRCTLKASDTPISTESSGEKCCVYNSRGTPNLLFGTSNAINEKYRVFYSTSLLSGHGNDSAIGTVYIKPLHTVTITDTKDNSTVTKYSANGSALSFTATKNGTQIPYATYKGNTVLMAETETAGTYKGTIIAGSSDSTVTISYRDAKTFTIKSVIDRTSVGASNGTFNPTTDNNRTQDVTEGSTVTFTAAPNDGYEPVWSFSNNNYDILSGDKNSNTIRILPKDNLTVYVTFREKNSISKTAYTGNEAYLFSYTTKPESSSALSNGSAVNLYTDNDGNLFACLTSGDDNDYTNDVIKQGQIHYIAYASTNDASRTVDLLSGTTNPSYAASSAASTALNGIGFEGNHCGGDVEYKWLKIKPKNSGDTILVYIGKVNNNAVTFGSDKSGERKSFYLDAISGDPGTVSKSATVYAKTGAIRRAWGQGTVMDYDRFSYYSDVSVTYSDGSPVKSEASFDYSDVDGTHYKLQTCTVLQNQPLTVTVTIHDSTARQMYYVKGFNVNIGSSSTTESIIDEPALNNSGVYTCTITPTSNKQIEITPVYFYNTKYNTKRKFLKLKVEDFESAQKVWGNTIAVHTWYDSSQEEFDKTNSVANSTQNALGGYPGQPLIKESGSYYTQIPLTNNAGSNIKGVLLNNFVWDEVHSKIYGNANAQSYDYDDFLALSNLDDVDMIVFNFKYHTDNAVSNNGYSGNFNGSNVTTIMGTTTGVDLDDSSKFSTSGLKDGSTTYPWHVLVDYNDIPIDPFGNRLVVSTADETMITTANSTELPESGAANYDEVLAQKQKAEMLTSHKNYRIFDHHYYNDKYVLTKVDNDDKYFIVSNGYVNYYKASTENPLATTANEDFLGQYATMWHVYKYNGVGDYDLIGSLPPSAFITDKNYKTAYGVDSNNKIAENASVPLTFLAFAGDTISPETKAKMWTQFKAIYNECAGKPMQIKYEASIKDNGEDHAANNEGYRADGRWYFSRSTDVDPIYSEIKIWIKSDVSSSETAPTNYTFKKAVSDDKTSYYFEDTFDSTVTNKGSVTSAKAYFTNETPNDNLTKESFKNKTSAVVLRDPDSNFTFTANPTATGKTYTVNSSGIAESEANTSQKYKFVGWYLRTGGELNDMSSSNTHYISMDADSTLIAVYEPVGSSVIIDGQKKLTVYHDLYANKGDYSSAVTNGTSEPDIANGRQGTTHVTITIKRGEDNIAYSSGTTMAEIDPTELALTDQVIISMYTTPGANNEVLTETVSETSIPSVYYYDSQQTTRKFKLPSNAANSPYTYDTANTATGVTTYTATVSELFGTDSEKTLYFFTNLFRTYINVDVKYYDRDLGHSKPVDMSDDYTHVKDTVNITQNEKIGYLAANGMNKFNVIVNEMDEYDMWLTQSEAVGANGILAEDYYDITEDPVTHEKSSTKTTYGAQFTNVTTTPELKYHTNKYGKLITEATQQEKWVTYYDADGVELTNNDALTDESTLNNVSKVVVWLYNQPKAYHFSAYYTPAGKDAQGKDIVETNLTKISSNDKDLYVCASNNPGQLKDSEGSIITYTDDKGAEHDLTVLTGFYNQRLGVIDPRENAITNDTTNYLKGYGVFNPFFGGIENGVDVTAAQTGIYTETDTSVNLVFDGWYTKESDGKYTLLCTDRTYQNRMTNDLTLYAVYRPAKETVENEEVNTKGTPVSVSISEVVTDKYVDEKGNKKVRINTQLNVTGVDVDESDSNIRYVSAIYYSLPNSVGETAIDWTSDANQQVLEDNAATIRSYVENHMAVLDETKQFNITSNSVPDVSDKYFHTYTTKMKAQEDGSRPLYAVTVEVNEVELDANGVVDCFTYKVVDNTNAAATELDLTNKNRVQFSLVMSDEKFNNCEFVAFVAIKYWDLGEDGPKGWYVSDNCISFTNGNTKTYNAVSSNANTEGAESGGSGEEVNP